MKSTTPNTIVLPIDWKESFFFYPSIIIPVSKPLQCRIICISLSDDGEALTIMPYSNGAIDDILLVLEGCFNEKSNFHQILKEYYGERSKVFREFLCNFNGVNLTLSKGMTAMDAKLIWLRNAIKAGHHYLLLNMSAYELETLRNDPCMKKVDSELFFRVYQV